MRRPLVDAASRGGDNALLIVVRGPHAQHARFTPLPNSPPWLTVELEPTRYVEEKGVSLTRMRVRIAPDAAPPAHGQEPRGNWGGSHFKLIRPSFRISACRCDFGWLNKTRLDEWPWDFTKGDKQMTATRRNVLKGLGVLGAAAAIHAPRPVAGADEDIAQTPGDDARAQIAQRVATTPMVDTHEHLPDEDERLRGERVACDDWGVLFSHYIDSDLISAGMPEEKLAIVRSRDADSQAKWQALEPYWPCVKHTGYGQAVRIAMRELYGVDDLAADSVDAIAEAYGKLRAPGMYQRVLVDTAGIESCQVNYLWRPFKESRQPLLLMQDISFIGMHMNPDIRAYAEPAGIQVKSLEDWHRVITWWFDRYGPYAVAVKSQAAYSRGLDFEQVDAQDAAPAFDKYRAGQSLEPAERKCLEDHLFWYCVGEATRHKLPVKLHTGYYAGQNGMPLARVLANPGQASELCRKARDTTFVFMHIGYPAWQEMIALAKHYTNAVIDMCWAWIIDPVGSKQFLKSFLVTAPANKVLTFGGDYIPVECVVGHARLARQGIARALQELVEEEWLTLQEALELVDPLLRGNAHRLFNLEEKAQRLETAPW